jgi:penicillin-binding protein-related factor A (putative recombinase)
MKHIWKDAEEEFVSFFAPFGKHAYVQRLSDTAFVRGTSGRSASFKDAQPSDFIVTWLGNMFYAEVKSTINEPSFPFSMIKKPQWAAAKQAVAAKGGYYFWIKRETASQWYVVPARIFIEHDAKSIRWDALETYKLQPLLQFSQLAK